MAVQQWQHMDVLIPYAFVELLHEVLRRRRSKFVTCQTTINV